MELAPGLHRIGNDIVAAYLVEDESGLTLIDAGLAGQWKDLTAELTSMGRTPGDIRALILTHGDTDHIGFAERLRREFGVPVYCHAADAARARGEFKSKPTVGKVKLGPLLKFLGYAIAKRGMSTTYLTSVTSVADGQVLDAPGAPQIMALPGHSPGSIAVHVPLVDAVFVGDGLTTRHVLTGKVGPQPAPFTDDPAQAIESLERLRKTGAKWVLPGHGAPWSEGVAAAIDAVTEAYRTMEK